MQVFDEDGPREDLISEGEIDLTNILKEGEEDSKCYRFFVLLFLLLFRCVCVPIIYYYYAKKKIMRLIKIIKLQIGIH